MSLKKAGQFLIYPCDTTVVVLLFRRVYVLQTVNIKNVY